MKNWKNWLIVPPVILGIIVFAVLVSRNKGPQQVSAKERVRAVRIITAPRLDVVPRSIGYGYVEPGQSWEAVAEVSGRIVEMHDQLKKGFFIKKDELLLKIDTGTYDLAEERGKATVMSIDARLNELEQNKKNIQRLLATEKKSLKLSGQELERKRQMFKKDLISKSALEKEEKSYLAQQTSVNTLQNNLDLIPAQRKSLLAQKTSGVSTLADSQLNLAKTIIRAPFDCRIASVNVELEQFANAGSVLVTVEGVKSVEIPVTISPRAFANLLPKMDNEFDLLSLDMDAIRKAIGISATVRLPFFRKGINWHGWFSRTSESIDIATGVLTVYVVVDNPYEKMIPGQRPPLMKNMYCEVELKGRPRSGKIVIPQVALHHNTVYIVNPENRLEIRAVTIGLAQGQMVVIEEGVKAGEKIVVTDLLPAISGMLLKPVMDEKMLDTLKQLASGKGELK